jgi:hypothetical protein
MSIEEKVRGFLEEGTKARCRLCGDIIHSQHDGDFQSCSCGKSFVDNGGTDWCRLGGEIDMKWLEEQRKK